MTVETTHAGEHTITFEVVEADALTGAHRRAEELAWEQVQAAGGDEITDLRLVSIERKPDRPGRIEVTAAYSSVTGGLRAS